MKTSKKHSSHEANVRQHREFGTWRPVGGSLGSYLHDSSMAFVIEVTGTHRSIIDEQQRCA